MNTKELIEFYIDNNILISPDIVSTLSNVDIPLKTKFSVITQDTMLALISKQQILIEDFEEAIVLKEKHKNSKKLDRFKEYLATTNISKNISKTPPINIQHPSFHTNAPEILKTEKKLEQEINSSESLAIEELKEVLIEQPNSTFEHSVDFDNKKPTDDKEAREDFLKKNRIIITSSYNTKSKKWSVQDFVNVYRTRFVELEKILRSRTELNNLTSISRISAKKERENIALIGVVYDKALTKAGNIMLTIEDPTGMIKVVITKKKEDQFKLAEEIQLDEVIGVTGMFDQIVFASNLFIPDIPLTKELKKSPEEGYFVVISDTEPGSKLFLEKEFEKLLSWLGGELGNEKQRDVASKVKYVFIVGDLVAGVGIYPNQEFDLNIIDIYDQYKRLAELLKKIPEHIPIIICPGNHDVGRISEPQPPLNEDYAVSLLNLPNIISVSNPSMLKIYSQPETGFDGFDVMLYHGLSFVYYSEHIPLIRRSGGQKRPDLIMKYLLQRRHLAPSHTSTLYVPDPKKDPLLIDKIPDFLISGHVHRATVSNYKNVTCINASCWTAQSDEQERRGLEAQPGRAFIVDMHTREVKIMNFLSREDQDKDDKEKEVAPAVIS